MDPDCFRTARVPFRPHLADLTFQSSSAPAPETIPLAIIVTNRCHHRGGLGMTKAEIKRLVDATIEAARKNGVTEIEVRIDGAIVRIPLAPSDKPVADAVVADDKDDWSA
jgi:hypothetical protein